MRFIPWLALVVGATFAASTHAERTSADALRRSKVFASVGSETITVGELEDILATRSPYVRRRLTRGDALRDMADAQMQSELFYQAALMRGYAEDPKVKRLVEETMVNVFVRHEIEERARPSDAEIAAYYASHPDEFKQPEMRRARHVLVGSEAEARDVRALITSGKTDFAGLAKARSLDTETNVRGGDLLFFTAQGDIAGRKDGSKIDPTLTAAAYALDAPGDLSPPLDLGDDNWSVVELTEIRPARVRPLDLAAAQIRSKLRREEADRALAQLVATLRAELQPEIHTERIETMPIPPASALHDR